jgi:hypothetical protein
MLKKLITNNTAECAEDKKRCYSSQDIVRWKLDIEIWFDVVKCHPASFMTEGF